MPYELPRVSHTYLSVPESDLKVPVVELVGGDGPVFTFTAGVHADEYVGEQALVELARELEEVTLAGTVRLVPLVNVASFARRGTSMVTEPAGGPETNLNRVFPGDPRGNLGERIAHTVFEGCIRGSDFHADLHSGDYYEDLAPHTYYLSDVAVSPVSARMAAHADIGILVPYGGARRGNLIVAAAVAGVPSVLLERGGMGAWSRPEVDAAKADVLNLLRFAGIVEGPARDYGPTQIAFPDDRMVDYTAPMGGFWYPARRSGERFAAGEKLGRICDAFGAELYAFEAERPGVVVYQTGSLNVIAGGPMIAVGYFA